MLYVHYEQNLFGCMVYRYRVCNNAMVVNGINMHVLVAAGGNRVV